jgi:hypothetical protein
MFFNKIIHKMNKFKKILRFMLTPKVVYNLMKYYNYYANINDINDSILEKFRVFMFPFLGNGNFETKNGNLISIPRKYWMTMPTIARVINYGAHPKWEENLLFVSLNDIVLANFTSR